jgi:hypothetical protein
MPETQSAPVLSSRPQLPSLTLHIPPASTEVNSQQASLSTPLDELIGLDDELVGEDPGGKSRVRREGSSSRVVGNL